MTSNQDLVLEYLLKYYPYEQVKDMELNAELRRALALQDMEFFARYYLPHHFYIPLAPLHQKLFQDLQEMMLSPGDEKRLEIVFRGAGKTTISDLSLPLWCICLCEMLGARARHHIVIISDSFDQAKTHLSTLKTEIEENEAIQQDFGEFQGRHWTEGLIETSNRICVLALGSGMKIRGRKYKQWRPDLIIFDDIENDSNVQSETMRRQLLDWIKSAVMNAGSPDLKLLGIGNYLHYECALRKLYDNPLFKKRVYRALISPWPFDTHPRNDLWEKWTSIITNRADVEKEDHALAFFQENKQEMMRGVEVAWPERYDYYTLRLKYVAEGPSAFSTELQNEPMSPEERFFQKYHSYRSIWNYEDRGKDIWLVPWDRTNNKPSGWPAVPMSECTLFAATDPSMGEGLSSHPSAIVIVAQAPTNQRFCIYADEVRRVPTQIIHDQNNLWQKYPQILRWAIESNQMQKFFGEVSGREALSETGTGLPLVPVGQSNVQKTLRIQSLQPDIQNGYILFNVEGQECITTHLDRYPVDTTDPDVLDALEMALSLSKDWSPSAAPSVTVASTHQFGLGEPTTEDYYKEMDDMAVANHARLQRLKEMGIEDPEASPYPITWF